MQGLERTPKSKLRTSCQTTNYLPEMEKGLYPDLVIIWPLLFNGVIEPEIALWKPFRQLGWHSGHRTWKRFWGAFYCQTIASFPGGNWFSSVINFNPSLRGFDCQVLPNLDSIFIWPQKHFRHWWSDRQGNCRTSHRGVG